MSKSQPVPVNLATVLQLVNNQSLPVASTQASYRIAKAQAFSSLGPLLPSVEGSVLQSRLKGGTQVFGGQVVSVVRSTVQPQVSGSWTINPGGYDVFTYLSARKRQTEATRLVTQTIQQELAGAAQDYYKLLNAESNRDQALQAIKEATTQVALNQKRLTVGIGNMLDLLKAQTLLVDQQQTLVQAEADRATAEQALLYRLNLDPAIAMTTDVAERNLHPLLNQAVPLPTLYAVALQQNPQYLKQEQELKALGIDRKAIWSSVVPAVTLRAYLNGTGPDWNSLVKTDYHAFTVNMTFLDNLGVPLTAQLMQNRATIEKALIDLKTLARSLESSVTTAYINSHTYQVDVETARQDQALAAKTLEVALARFKAGFGTNLDVVEAETSLVNARVKVSQAILNYNQAQVNLLQALGLATQDYLQSGVPDRALTLKP